MKALVTQRTLIETREIKIVTNYIGEGNGESRSRHENVSENSRIQFTVIITGRLQAVKLFATIVLD